MDHLSSGVPDQVDQYEETPSLSLPINPNPLTYLKFTFIPRMESIEKMESDFKNCHMFLVTILNKAVCRGSFPHCEYLMLKYFCFSISL